MLFNPSGGTSFSPYTTTFASTGTFTVPVSGKYLVVAIGHGASGYATLVGTTLTDYRAVAYPGYCGGAGYITLNLLAGQKFNITITDTNSIFSTESGANIINATAGSTSLSGDVSGAGVTPFSSNKTKTRDIAPPDIYNLAAFASMGGRSGAGVGGNGLFGRDGGDGGHAVAGTSGYGAPGGERRNGSGAGGNGYGGYINLYESTYANIALPGGGGGGAFGGGSGVGASYTYYYRTPRIISAGSGKGAAGGVFVERIG